MNQISKDIFLWQLCLNLLVRSTHWSLYELEVLAAGGGRVLEMFYNPISSYIPSFSATPWLSLASPTLPVYEGPKMPGYFLRTCGRSVIHFLLGVGFIYEKKTTATNNADIVPAQLDSSPRTGFQRAIMSLDKVTTLKGRDRVCEGQRSIPFPFWKTPPRGNTLAFPAKHELAWQSDQLITPVHLIPYAWLITIASPRTEWIQLQ